MSRLPTPGSDDNTWGDILNDYLGVSIATDGSLKSNVVSSANIVDGTIVTADISATAGIVKTQLASAVQTSLGLADTALQSVTPATSTVTGGVRLTGDLGGTATAPTTPTAVHVTGAETIAGVKTFSSSPTVPAPTATTDAANKTYVDTAVAAVGSGLTQQTSQTSSFTAAAGKFYPVNATSGAITVTLPASSGSQIVVIKKTDGSSNAVTLSGTINGASTTLSLRYQNQAKELIADGGGGWTVEGGDIDIVTTLASTTLPGFVQLAGDLAGTGSVPTVAKLNGVTLSTTAPTAGQALVATSATAAAWSTVSATDSSKVAKSGDTMTGGLTMPNQNSIKTTAPTDIYQWFYSDPTSINQVPFGDLWHDLLAFNKLYTVTAETTTNGSTWTSATVNKKLFAHLENQAIQVIDGTVQGIRWTFNNTAYSTGRWLMIAYTYLSTAPNVVIYVQSSSDGSTWTNRHNSSYTAGVAPVWHYVQDNGGDGYLRIMIQAGTAVNISSIRFYSSRWGDQGAGSEIEQPYTWNENGWIGIGKGTTAPGYALDVTGDARVIGQIHNVTDPTAAQDVATKAYVDANAGGGANVVTTNTAQTITGAKTFQNDIVVSGSPATTLINENQSATPAGTMYGSATYVAGSYTRLTTAVNNLNGELEYIIPSANYAGSIDATFDIWAGGGSSPGADGIWFYAGSTTTGTYEAAVDGYAVFLNEYVSSQIRLYFNGTQIASADIPAIGDSTWRTVRFTLSSSGAAVVYINGTSALTYSDIVRTLPGTRWGFGSRTGGYNNEHRVRNMKVTTGVTAPYGITVGSTIIKNGKISNVTDPTAAQDAATKAYVDSAATGGAVYAVDVNNIGLPIVGANGITVTETASAITIGYSGSGGSAGGSTGVGNASTYSSVSLGTGDGSTNAQSIASGSFVTINLNTVVSDIYSNYSTSAYQYTVPATGTYLISGRIRVVDGDTSTNNMGIGVHTTNNDGYWFKWNSFPGSTNRKSFDYTRVDNFNQGDKLRMFVYGSSAFNVNNAGLSIIRLDTVPGSSGSGGNSRVVAQVASAMTAAAVASTDYVYYWSGSTAYALTLPTAVSNTGRYTLKNASTVSQVVMTTSSQTIDGGTTITITPGNSVDLISTNANWIVI